MRHPGVFFFLLFLTAADAVASKPLNFCVQTFNSYGPAYASGKNQRTKAFAASIRETDPLCEVIQLQELWQQTHFEQLKTEFQPLRYLPIRNDEHRNDDHITGLASFFQGSAGSEESIRYEVNNERGFLDWFRDFMKVAKGYSLTGVKLDKAPKPIFFINTHTHPNNTSIRLAQMLQLSETILTHSLVDHPIVLTGDLNATPDSLELELLKNILLLKDSYLELHGSYDRACTYCGTNPLSWSREDRVLDYILYRGRGALQLLPTKSEINLQHYENIVLSDHYGVRTYFSLQNSLPPSPSTKFEERLESARLTLQKIKNILQQDGSSYLENSIRYTDRLLLEIEAKDNTSALFRYFLQE